MKDLTISRRSLLKGFIAAASTAAIACEKEEDAVYGYVDTPITGGSIQFDKDVRIVNSTGPHNCGSRCRHKVHVKNDRIVGFTSAGDIPMAECGSDEWVAEDIDRPIQRRACVRGYGYTQKTYQPDRLKYPMIQTGEKGDLSTFKRVTWDEAIDLICEKLESAAARKPTLGYFPLIGRWYTPRWIEGTFAPTIINYFGNESTGSQDAAKYDSVGPQAYSNNVADMLNSKFILTWGLDPSRATYWKEHAHWYSTKAKESKIPIVVISPTCSDMAAIIATGTTATIKNGSVVNIPAWVPIRPATDGLLAETMAYIIWNDNILTAENKIFLKDHCFGFYPDSEQGTVTSTAAGNPLGIGKYAGHFMINPKNLTSPDDITNDPNIPLGVEKHKPYNGKEFKVPSGESFVEHLDSLTVAHSSREGVLANCAKITGVPANIIEALAYKYGKCNTDDNPALLDVGGGPNRAWNGMEWNWLCICLAAMTGNIKRKGGGAGFAMTGFTDKLAFDQMGYVALPDPSCMLNPAETCNSIQIQTGHLAHVLHTGKDRKSWARFQADVKLTTSKSYYNPMDVGKPTSPNGVTWLDYGLDLANPLEIDIIWVQKGNILTTTENINKTILGFCKPGRTVISIDNHMTATATYADIILPACTHLEAAGGLQINSGVASSATIFSMDQAIRPLYSSKPDTEIEALIAKRLLERGMIAGLGFDTKDLHLSYGPADGTVYTMMNVSQLYKDKVNPNAKMPSQEEVNEKGMFELVVPADKPIIGMKDFFNIDNNDLETTTGRINFYSPLWGGIRKGADYTLNSVRVNNGSGADAIVATRGEHIGWQHDGIRNATAKYQPSFNGYELLLNDTTKEFEGYISPFSNRKYTLQYLTNKSRHRAHTVLSSTAIIDDNFKQRVKMNPIDATARGISDGELVYVYNDRGCMKIEAEVTDYIVPGVISIEHGAWYRAHPTEKCSVWLDTEEDNSGNLVFVKHTVPVDVGGAENILTYDVSGSEQYVGQAVSAQGGPCEISKQKPE